MIQGKNLEIVEFKDTSICNLLFFVCIVYSVQPNVCGVSGERERVRLDAAVRQSESSQRLCGYNRAAAFAQGAR